MISLVGDATETLLPRLTPLLDADDNAQEDVFIFGWNTNNVT